MDWLRFSNPVQFASVSDDLRKWAGRTVTKRPSATKAYREFTLHWLPAGDSSEIVATSGDRVVGSLFYGREDPRDAFLKGAVEVHPDYRRRGLATAMYSWAEELTGMQFVPDTPHTPYAAALWGQRDRPFGRR